MKIKRRYFNSLVKQISEPKISILIGARQVGKTHLLKELEAYCKQQGRYTKYFNLENPEDAIELNLSDLELYKKLTGLPDASVVFIDEFHYIKNASKLFKAIYDSGQKIKIFASGSSSIELHKHLKESLAGRMIKNKIEPLNIEELKQIKGYKLEDYFIFGGLPGLIHLKTMEEKLDLLKNIVDTYILKDIKSLLNEENLRAFNNLMYILAQNQGSIISVSSLAKEVRLSEPTVRRHLDILEQTFVSFELSSYSKNLANELKKSKKNYLYDLGIRNLILKDFSAIKEREDIGVIVESFVFNELRTNLKPNMELKFWRTKHGDEVDFILLKNRKAYPIEVKTTWKTQTIPKSLKSFINHYPDTKKAYIVCQNLKESFLYKNTVVNVINWFDISKIDELSN